MSKTTERRFDARYMCADLVRVSCDCCPDGPQTLEAILEDICAVGACVQVERELPVGAAITLAIGEARYSGHISYCVFRDYGYFAGIRFSEDTEWSSDQIEPRHLINLEGLTH